MAVSLVRSGFACSRLLAAALLLVLGGPPTRMSPAARKTHGDPSNADTAGAGACGQEFVLPCEGVTHFEFFVGEKYGVWLQEPYAFQSAAAMSTDMASPHQ